MGSKITLDIWALAIVMVFLNCGSPGSQTEPPAGSGETASQLSQVIPPTASNMPCSSPSPDAKHKVVISAPCNGSKVGPRHFVQGLANDATTGVAVIVHPVETSDFWAQPNVTVREDGTWKVLCYFGEPGPQHSAKHFEVVALVNPKQALREGQLFSTWPEAESKSQVIEVIRE